MFLGLTATNRKEKENPQPIRGLGTAANHRETQQEWTTSRSWFRMGSKREEIFVLRSGKRRIAVRPIVAAFDGPKVAKIDCFAFLLTDTSPHPR